MFVRAHGINNGFSANVRIYPFAYYGAVDTPFKIPLQISKVQTTDAQVAIVAGSSRVRDRHDHGPRKTKPECHALIHVLFLEE